MFDRLLPQSLLDAALQDLRSRGVVAGSIVAWLSHNRWEMVATLVACRQLGAVLLPLNWRLAASELAAICSHAGATHLMASPELTDVEKQMLDLAQLVPRSDAPASDVQPGDLLLVYTSGTTGQPKGAMHSAAGLIANAQAAIEAQGLDAQTRVLTVLPLFHVGGLCIQTLPALAAGAQVLLHPRFEPEAWFDAVAQWRPTTTLLVPAVMKALVEHPRWAAADLSSLAFVNSGSQIVPLALIQRFHDRGIPVAQVYGATETGPVSIVLKPGQAVAHAGKAGWPALGVQVKLGPDGEVCLKAPQLMRGYHRSSEASFDAAGWFRTGDLALQHADGMFEICGRSKELIISGGENIHPAEVEHWVAQVHGVLECAVVGLPDAQWGEVPVLAVVLRPGAKLDRAALQAVLDKQLARFKHPKRIEFVQQLPKTALGKVQRTALVRVLSEAQLT